MNRKLTLAVLFASMIAATAAYAGMFSGFPFASSTATQFAAATLPMTGSECIPGDTNLSGGRPPQTACYTQGNLQGNYVTTVTTPVASNTVTWDVAGNANLYATTALTGNITLSNPTGLTTGQVINLMIKQDGTGSRTVTWGTYFTWPAKTGGAVTAPTLSTTASTADILTFVYDGTKLFSRTNQTSGQGLVY